MTIFLNKFKNINSHLNTLFLKISVIVASVFFIIISLFHYFTNDSDKIIPRKILFGPADKTNVKLSSDGKYISYLASDQNVIKLWITPINDLSKARIIINNTERGIRHYYWSGNSQHLIYLQDNEGDENNRIYSYNFNTDNTKLLTSNLGTKSIIYKIGKNKLIIGLNERNKKYFDVYEINLENYDKKLLYENNQFSNFLIDDNLKIRFGVLINKEGDKEYFELKNEEWKFFMKIPFEDAATSNIIKFSKDGNRAYFLDSRESNTASLKILDIDTKEFKIIAEDKQADVQIFTSDPNTKNIQAIITDYDKKLYRILDESIRPDIDFLINDKLGDLSILKRANDDKTWLISYHNDVNPIKYFIYDRLKKKLEFLFSSRSKLDNYTMLPMHSVIIKSRDGLDLVSYITFPTKREIFEETAKPMPLVLLVHGGPWSRDYFGFNNLHQWLANRGYTVLSVNFRGSTGFGKQFLNAGNMEWGGKMQDDLIDAVNWSIANKIADPNKICIMGSSYGGYAALTGLSFTPNFFACGVSIAGPSNLQTLMNNLPSTWQTKSYRYKKIIGVWDSDEGKEFLKIRSPLTFAHDINKPLFIAHGANDPRVLQMEADQIYNILNSQNNPVFYAVFKDEGHGLVRHESRLSLYAMIEKFLSITLGGKFEPVGSDFENANFTFNGKENVSAKIVEEIFFGLK